MIAMLMTGSMAVIIIVIRRSFFLWLHQSFCSISPSSSLYNIVIVSTITMISMLLYDYYHHEEALVKIANYYHHHVVILIIATIITVTTMTNTRYYYHYYHLTHCDHHWQNHNHYHYHHNSNHYHRCYHSTSLAFSVLKGKLGSGSFRRPPSSASRSTTRSGCVSRKIHTA